LDIARLMILYQLVQGGIIIALAGAIYYIIRYWPLSLWAVAIGDNLHCRAGIAAVLIVLACAAINILWHGKY
ncbi:MAG: hypothetical protein LLF95_03065, partial [Bacteroidales bacterium]|nr:hypothetical protein [Bacteroidales bacterium]